MKKELESLSLIDFEVDNRSATSAYDISWSNGSASWSRHPRRCLFWRSRSFWTKNNAKAGYSIRAEFS